MYKMLIDLPAEIETERLILRSYQPGDGAWYFEMCQKNQDHLRLYEGQNPVLFIKTVDEAEATVRDFWAAWVARNAFFMCGLEKTNGSFAVQIYVGPMDWGLPEFEIGYFAEKDHVGKGFVSEAVKAAIQFAFETFKAQRLSLHCDETNVRSQRVAERCGFVKEGFLRENKRYPDGTLTGTHCYGLLKKDFYGKSS